MKRTIRTTVAATAALTLLAACGGCAGASEDGEFTPDGDVTMLMPFAAGGGSDLAGRATAAAWRRPTTTSTSTWRTATAAPARSGTPSFLGEAGNAQVPPRHGDRAARAAAQRRRSSWTYEDFTPIMKVAEDFTLMVARADAPYETCADVVEAAKSDRVVAGHQRRDGPRQRGVHPHRAADRRGVRPGVVRVRWRAHRRAARRADRHRLPQPGRGDRAAASPATSRRCAPTPTSATTTRSSRTSRPPSEQGIDVSFAQFRGVLAPGGISDSAKDYWVEQMEAAVETDEYNKYIEDNFLQPNTAAGDEFSAYLEENNAQLQEVTGRVSTPARRIAVEEAVAYGFLTAVGGYAVHRRVRLPRLQRGEPDRAGPGSRRRRRADRGDLGRAAACSPGRAPGPARPRPGRGRPVGRTTPSSPAASRTRTRPR